MRRVPYKQVLQAASVLWSGEQDPSAQDAAFLNVPIHRRAREFWESYWFPELMAGTDVRRQFRANWLAITTYGVPTATAATERYYPPARKYYQSLRAANTGNVPATLTGSDYIENSAWWAECRESYSGDDWVTGTTYTFVAGSPKMLRNPADNRFYQLHTSHVAGASLDGTKFGILTPFVRSIALEQSDENGVALTKIGEVRRVWPSDPMQLAYWLRGKEVSFQPFGDSIIVSGCLPIVYLEYRKRPFAWLYTALYATTTTFGADVYVYDATTGDVYRSLAAGNLNNPVTDTTKWERQDFPYVLEQCVSQAAYADGLRSEKDTEGFALELAEGNRLRDVAVSLAEKQQKEQMRVV